MCIELVNEAVDAGARRYKACDILGISVRTLQRWEKEPEGEDQRQGPKSKPENILSEAEKQLIIAVATSPGFRDLSPSQIVPILAEKGVYIGSEASFKIPAYLFIPKNVDFPVPAILCPHGHGRGKDDCAGIAETKNDKEFISKYNYNYAEQFTKYLIFLKNGSNYFLQL